LTQDSQAVVAPACMSALVQMKPRPFDFSWYAGQKGSASHRLMRSASARHRVSRRRQVWLSWHEYGVGGGAGGSGKLGGDGGEKVLMQ
jgi:hypothetical protein